MISTESATKLTDLELCKNSMTVSEVQIIPAETVSDNAVGAEKLGTEWPETDLKREDICDVREISSLDSFPLTDSPEGTSTSVTSHESSWTSLSGLNAKTPDKNETAILLRSKFQGHKKNDRSLTGSSLFNLDFERSPRSEYTQLKNQCTKFASRTNAAKANYLRLTLLPFLRSRTVRLLPPAGELEFPLKVYGLWWTQILEVAKSNFKNVRGSDRNAFYEALSGIISRPEWNENQDSPTYQSLLAQTTTHVLTKFFAMGSPNVTQCAFGGKVLAYAYMYLPGFAVYLLICMSIDTQHIDRLLSADAIKSNSSKSSKSNSSSSSSDNTSNGGNSIISLSKHLQHLAPLTGAREVPSFVNYRQRLAWLPREQCFGWERHFDVDSALFASFFKNLCALQTQFLPIDLDNEDQEFMEEGRMASLKSALSSANRCVQLLLASPGMLLVLAHIVSSLDKIIEDSDRRNSPRHSSGGGGSGSSNSSSSSPLRMRQSRTNKPGETPNNNSDTNAFSVSPGRVRIDLLKVFSVFREVLHADHDTSPHFLAFSRIFDQTFKAMAAAIRLYDMEGCVTVCNIAEEWFSSVFSVKATRAEETINAHKQLAVDWNFWLTVIKRMLESDNTHTEIRALSFLFNLWPHLPNDESLSEDNTRKEGHERERKSILRETTEWLLSPPKWTQLFCHWSPLVRSYFHRILCYRLASVGVDNNNWILDVESAEDMEESRRMLRSMLSYTFNWCEMLSQKTNMKPETDPSLPLPRLRVGIRRFGPIPGIGQKPETNKARSYPFDVFDTAAYSTSDQDSSFVGDDSERYKSLDSSSSSSSPRLGRSASFKSCASAESVTSVSSTASNMSTFSMKSVASTLQKFSLKSVGTNTSNANSSTGTVNERDRSSKRQSVQKAPGDETAAQTNKKFKDLRRWFKLLSRKPDEENETEVSMPNFPSSAASAALTEDPKIVEHKEKAVNANESKLLSPFQLTQHIPEIARSSFRFVMVPTNAQPPPRPALAAPRLPFSQLIYRNCDAFDSESRDVGRDLTYWNYGGRSLAEWNLEVTSFEHFAQHQKHLANDSMEMFEMPFLVAEIPWRMIA